MNGLASELGLDVSALVSGTSGYHDDRTINHPTSVTMASEVNQGLSSDSDTITDEEMFSDLERFVEKSLKHETKRLQLESSKNALEKKSSQNLCPKSDFGVRDIENTPQTVNKTTAVQSYAYRQKEGCKDITDLDMCKVKHKKVKASIKGDKIKNKKTTFSDVNRDSKTKFEIDNDFSQVDKSYISQHTSNIDSEHATKNKKGKFHCKDCNLTFKLLGPFKNHKKTGGKCVFTCDYCGKVYKARYYSNYLRHLRYHSMDRPYRCKLCDKSYIMKNDLEKHERIHSGKKSYICEVCGKGFYTSSQLICHRHSAHTVTTQVYQCDLCGTALKNIYNLQFHKRTVHSDNRPFTCEICGHSFKTKKGLNEHSKVHKEVFPFVCDFKECKKAFKRPEGLRDHMKRHLNKRSHFCKTCDKGFYGSKDLREHMRTHSGEKPFSCHQCGYKCALRGNLTKHMRTHEGP